MDDDLKTVVVHIFNRVFGRGGKVLVKFFVVGFVARRRAAGTQTRQDCVQQSPLTSALIIFHADKVAHFGYATSRCSASNTRGAACYRFGMNMLLLIVV